MRYVVNPVAALGATSDQTSIDTASVLNVGARLRQAQADLTNLLQAMRDNPELARAIGRDVVAQQQSLGDLIAKYVFLYNAVFGQPPVGLGVAQIVVAGVAAGALLAVIIGGLVVWWEHESAIKQQAQAVTIASQNQAALIAQAQAIQKQADDMRATDPASAATLDYRANQIFSQAGVPNTSGQVPPKPASFFDWLQQNWITAALIVGAVIVIPKVAGEL